MKDLCDALNTLSEYLAVRDIPELSGTALRERIGSESADLIILFGGSIPHGCEAAGRAFSAGLAKRLMLVGGVGHTTDHLRRCINERYPEIETAKRAEADIIADYLSAAFGIEKSGVIIENRSANCGENVTFALEKLKQASIQPRNAIIMQDSSMQRRMDATFRRHCDWDIINYAAYAARFFEREGKLSVEPDIWGMWDVRRCASLLLGEIPRLRDDETGYGPNGKGFISHVDIPKEVSAAFEAVRKSGAFEVRTALTKEDGPAKQASTGSVRAPYI